MILNLSKTVWVVVEVGEQHPLLVVWTTEDLVLVEIELVSHTEPERESWRSGAGRSCVLPVATLLAGEALQVVDVGPGSHHHLEGGDHLVTRRAVARGPEQSVQQNN